VTPEMKERVLATVNELIESCCEGDPCHCDDDPEDRELAWWEEGPDSDYEFERRWDGGEGR
jgi:hypothetical protein